MQSLYASLEKCRPQILSILRIMAGLLFMAHGLQKLFGFPVAFTNPMTTLLYVQAVIEVVGGLLIAVGAFTRPVAFILSGDMAVAYFMAHFPRSFFPIGNGGDGPGIFLLAEAKIGIENAQGQMVRESGRPTQPCQALERLFNRCVDDRSGGFHHKPGISVAQESCNFP